MSETEFTPTGPPDAMTPHLSPLRIVVAIALLAGLVAGGSRLAPRLLEPDARAGQPWFAPYVDVASMPTFDFQDANANPSREVVLSFVVASRDDPCAPAWAAIHGLDAAATELDLDRRITRFRDRGGDVIVSFGGAANHELSDACTDPAALADAYRAVVNRYRLAVIDLDLEGATLDDAPGMRRRAAAIAALQANRRSAGHELKVWLTLPMSTRGLEPEGTAAIDAMLAAHVELAGVNVMAMEFGASRPSTTSFADASLAGIDATAGQLRDAYRRAGQPIAEGESYRRIGVTPMIGQNITPSDRLDVDGAQALYAGAVRRGVLRFSMWSLNRDRPCVGNIDPLIANDLCSGVPQEKLAFSHIFGAGNAPAVANEQVAFATASRVQTRQADAAAAPNNVGPYDAWRPHREYEADDKVVWNGRVFVAKWWNVDNQPDALVEHDWDTPWRLVGPVLATDPGPPTPPTVPPNTYPTWNRLTTFNAGDRVERRGVAYEAKWASRGEDPAADVDNDWQTPWKVVSPDAADPRSDS